MIQNIFYLVLALMGLGFLVFIHELGHYIMARRVGMTVEAFSIGFGKPIYSWNVNGVKWQFCWLPFGGYVRIAGMEKKGSLEPYQIPDGFYGKKPWQRIKVALMGPLVNVAFAFVAFAIIWATGGQEKPFQQYTNIIGSVESSSPLYPIGVRPGDQFLCVDNKTVQGLPNLLITLALTEKAKEVKGYEIDYWTGKKKPFSYPLNPNLHGLEAAASLDVLPASYLIFNEFSSPASPMKQSGIQKGDRIVWVDGQLVFSQEQLKTILNEPSVMLTVRRGDQTFLSQVPRLRVSDLCLNSEQKSELDDWRHEAGLSAKVTQLYFIPYTISNAGVIENSVDFIDEEKNVPSSPRTLFIPLEKGDQIISAGGTPISSSFDLLTQLQTKTAQVIIQRSARDAAPASWEKADTVFENSFNIPQLSKIAQSIGTGQAISDLGDLHLLPPITLKPLSELPFDEKTKQMYQLQYTEIKKAIEKIEDPKERDLKLQEFEDSQKRLVFGVAMRDLKISYNPNPFKLFGDVLDQTWRTLLNLITGYVSPKALSGPIGIVQVLQSSWSNGIKDALFWLGFVSLNLAFLNLLPIPVLDGGHILFSVVESVTKKPLKAKTMERLIIPFIVLLIGFFIYITYQDLSRLLGH